MSTEPQPEFLTDEMLAARLRQLANALSDLSQRLPSLAREANTLAGTLDPSGLERLPLST